MNNSNWTVTIKHQRNNNAQYHHFNKTEYILDILLFKQNKINIWHCKNGQDGIKKTYKP